MYACLIISKLLSIDVLGSIKVNIRFKNRTIFKERNFSFGYIHYFELIVENNIQ